MAWSNNNWAHLYTDTALISLKQYKGVAFANAGDLKVKQLAFWGPPGTSAALRKEQATAFASLLDGIMQTWVPNFAYEKGFRATRSVKHIATVLTDGEKTVLDLGDAIDNCYRFTGENRDD